MKTPPFFFTLLVLPLFLVLDLRAAEKTESIDEDGDGRKETQLSYSGEQPIRAAVDKNGDGQPDFFTEYKNGKRFSSKADRDFDGKMDAWYLYNSAGNLLRVATDANHDGKPDRFKEFLQGSRAFAIEETDTNFDGKVDKRRFLQWNANKRIPLFNNNRMTYIPNPGYVTLWREEDGNFDGLIDVYYEKASKNPSKTKVGQPMNPLPTQSEEAEKPPKGSKPGEAAESLVQQMNKKYGYRDPE